MQHNIYYRLMEERRPGNSDTRLARAFVQALEKAPLVVPLAVLGAAATPPETFLAEASNPTDDCTVKIEVYRPDYDKRLTLTDKGELSVSCVGDATIKLRSSERGSIRFEHLWDNAPSFMFGLASGFLGGAYVLLQRKQNN